MPRERVFIFSKEGDRVDAKNPEIETYGTTFDTILEECFQVRPPISQVPLQEIKELKQSDDPIEIKAGMDRLGYSVEKAFLADRLRQLKKEEDS